MEYKIKIKVEKTIWFKLLEWFPLYKFNFLNNVVLAKTFIDGRLTETIKMKDIFQCKQDNITEK